MLRGKFKIIVDNISLAVFDYNTFYSFLLERLFDLE